MRPLIPQTLLPAVLSPFCDSTMHQGFVSGSSVDGNVEGPEARTIRIVVDWGQRCIIGGPRYGNDNVLHECDEGMCTVCAAMMLLGVRVGFCLYTARGTEIFSIVAISKALF